MSKFHYLEITNVSRIQHKKKKKWSKLEVWIIICVYLFLLSHIILFFLIRGLTASSPGRDPQRSDPGPHTSPLAIRSPPVTLWPCWETGESPGETHHSPHTALFTQNEAETTPPLYLFPERSFYYDTWRPFCLVRCDDALSLVWVGWVSPGQIWLYHKPPTRHHSHTHLYCGHPLGMMLPVQPAPYHSRSGPVSLKVGGKSCGHFIWMSA